jgi:hypothetical protein
MQTGAFPYQAGASNLNVALEDATTRRMALRTPPGGVKGFATRAARAAHAGSRAAHAGPRAAHAGPRAAAHATASPAVYMFSLSRKSLLRSEAEMALVMTAHVSFGKVPERIGWADSALKVLTSGVNSARLSNSGRVVAHGLVRLHRVEI